MRAGIRWYRIPHGHARVTCRTRKMDNSTGPGARVSRRVSVVSRTEVGMGFGLGLGLRICLGLYIGADILRVSPGMRGGQGA